MIEGRDLLIDWMHVNNLCAKRAAKILCCQPSTIYAKRLGRCAVTDRDLRDMAQYTKGCAK